MVNVVKWDGRREPFQRAKVARTLLRMGAPAAVAEQIARSIEREVYEGISTQTIFDMAVRRLERSTPAVALRRDLKSALAGMRPMPDFERYVRHVLRAHGYRVTANRTVQGFCVTHEIDGIAEREGRTAYLEVKHHASPHSDTPFDVTLAVKAKWDDLNAGFNHGVNSQRFDRVLLVCNTKLTEHARRYANCVGVDHLGWNEPAGRGFDRLIEDARAYPVTMLRRLTEDDRDALADAEILTSPQLIHADGRDLDVTRQRRDELVEDAQRILALVT